MKRYHIKEVQNLEVLCDVCESVIVGRQYRCVKCDKDLCQAHRRVLHVEYSNSGSEVAGNGLANRTLILCTECWPAISGPVIAAVTEFDG